MAPRLWVLGGMKGLLLHPHLRKGGQHRQEPWLGPTGRMAPAGSRGDAWGAVPVDQPLQEWGHSLCQGCWPHSGAVALLLGQWDCCGCLGWLWHEAGCRKQRFGSLGTGILRPCGRGDVFVMLAGSAWTNGKGMGTQASQGADCREGSGG